MMETERAEFKDSADKSNQHGQKSKLTWTEEIEVAGEELVASIKRLAAEGQVSRIRVLDPAGDIVLEMPLTIGAIAGGAVVIAAPILALLATFAVFVTKVKLEVVRSGNPPDNKPKPQ
jgi:Domain of unknown function (DUF4342)